MLSEALKRLFGDSSVFWRVPLLAVLTMTGIGSVFTLGYAFSVQDHIAAGGDEYPDVDLDYLWYGLKFSVAVIALLVPVYLAFGGLALPALLDVGDAALSRESVEAAWAAGAGALVAAGVVCGVWMTLLGIAMPGLMASFLDNDGRLISALDPKGVIRAMRSAPGEYWTIVFVLVAWAFVSLAIYLPLEMLLPTGSVVPMVVAATVIGPLAMTTLLLLQVMLGLLRRDVRESDPAMRVGWHHLEDQNASLDPAEATAVP